MDVSQIPMIESLCATFYESPTQEERSKAEQTLNEFFENDDVLSRCQAVMENSSSPYAQLLAVNALTKFISKPVAQLNLEQKIWLRNFVLANTYSRAKMPPYVTQSYTVLFAKLTKYNWNEEQGDKFVFRNVVDYIKKFISGDLQHCILAIQLLSTLVDEMNHYEPNRRLNEHRKVTNSFRDSSLLEIFTLSRDFLRDLLDNGIDATNSEQCQLLDKLVKLAYCCLSFDFTGNSLDDATDEMCTVQIPGSWRSLFVDFKTMNLFFELYRTLPSNHCATVVSCLAQMSAIRRSLFTNNERTEYFHNLISGVKVMLENISHLSDSATYHEFCKLLARLRAIYQLSEFVKAPNYADFVRLLAQFTINSLQMAECPANSLHYVLSMWHKLVASVPYMRSTEPHYLEKYAPEVTITYITTRLEHVPLMLRDENLTNALNDQTILQQQLEQIAIVARCCYKKVAQVILSLYDQTVNEYQMALSSNQVDNARIKEFQLCWLVYIIGAVIGARIAVSSSEDTDTPDSELICRVLCLVKALNTTLPTKTLDQLEIAIISFFDQFRRIYIGEQMQKISTVYLTLSEVLGLKDEMMILDLIVNKVLTNLKVWSSNSVILCQTLQLLNDLSLTYSGLRKLAKLDAVQFLLNNHSSETLPFLSIDNGGFSEDDFRHRTTFYTSLTRLLLVDMSDEDDRFDEFLKPLTASLDTLAQHLSNGALFNSEYSRRVFIGICRDLRGIVYALNTKTYFLMFFEWLYPAYTPIFHRAMEIWYSDPRVTSPLLKFYCELVQNRFQRLVFEISPLGILLFRECSLLLTNYGDRILATPVPKEKEYPMKLKGICCCFQALKNALSGNFINFAIFQLYEDKALDNSLKMFVRMLLSMSDINFLQYPKLSAIYYNLLECLAGEHIHFLANLDVSVFVFILQTIAQGLMSADSNISTSCCCTLDLIVTFMYKKISRQKKNKRRSLEPPVSDSFLQLPHTNTPLFNQMLTGMMTTVIYDELRNQWSLSRPLIGLILLQEDCFHQYRISQIQSQSEDKQVAMTQAFNNLMDGIERNLTNKNKDRFTQNVAVFRRDIGEALKTSKDNSSVVGTAASLQNSVAGGIVANSGDDVMI